MDARKLRPRGRDEDAFSNDQQGGKEDLRCMISIWKSNNRFRDSPGQAGGSPSIRSYQIDSSLVLTSRRTSDYRQRQFHLERTPRVPDGARRPGFYFSSQRRASKVCRTNSYRKAGSLPNSAIKVNPEIARITRPMVLRAPIMKLIFTRKV